jgi:predicted glycosyltransferase involved in capsule biosynthesis
MHNLSIVVPYRQRESHLKKFVPHIKSFLNNKINYKIFVIEQFNEKPFNRAKLLNVGFNVSKEENDYFCFHDIDMLPTHEDCDYSYFNGVCRLSHYVSQFNFIPRPENELGGVILVDKKSFVEVNGYSNNYWGWGVEDEDFATRCRLKNIPYKIRNGKYMSLFHKPNGDTYGDPVSLNTIKNREYYKNILENDLFSDGISNIQYTLVEKREYNDYTLIKVDI